MTVYDELDRLINRGSSRDSTADNLRKLGIGRYMASRWISMTLPKNAMVMSMFNVYGGIDDVEGLCGVASLFGGKFGRFSYIKKTNRKTASSKCDVGEDEWPDRFSKREVERMKFEIERLERSNKKNRKRAEDGKTSKNA